MRKRRSFHLTAATTILASLILTIPATAGPTPNTLISDSGKTLSSVFEGLRANPALRPDQWAKYQPLRRQWRGIGSSRLPGLSRIYFTEGAYCPTSTCEGNYAVIVSSGGCISSGCPSVNNFITDTQNGVCSDGAIDIECGGGDAGPCCANYENCPSPSTTGCHR